jgi:hypothetical protein
LRFIPNTGGVVAHHVKLKTGTLISPWNCFELSKLYREFWALRVRENRLVSRAAAGLGRRSRIGVDRRTLILLQQFLTNLENKLLIKVYICLRSNRSYMIIKTNQRRSLCRDLEFPICDQEFVACHLLLSDE